MKIHNQHSKSMAFLYTNNEYAREKSEKLSFTTTLKKKIPGEKPR
jgi:hypothetical protein